MNFNEFKAAYKECIQKGMLDREIVAFAKQSGMDGVTILKYIHLVQSGAGLPNVVKSRVTKFVFKLGFGIYGIVFLYGIWRVLDLVWLKGIPFGMILSAPGYEGISQNIISEKLFPLTFFEAHVFVFVPLLISFFVLKKCYRLRSKTLFLVASLTWLGGLGLLGYLFYETGIFTGVYGLNNIY